jgi:uncharacterized protein YndB with AHSA1/START domain
VQPDSCATLRTVHLTRDVVLPLPTAEAWELLTDPDELAAWLGTAPRLDLTPGGAVTLVEPDGTVRTLVIDEVEVGRRIGFTWWAGEDGPASHVEIAVDETEEGARVTVTETAPVRASVAGGVRRLPIGAGWDGRLVDLELRAMLREPALV